MTSTAPPIPEGRGEVEPVTAPALALLAGLAELHEALITAGTDDRTREVVARHLERWPADSRAEDALTEMMALHGLTDQLNGTATLEELLCVMMTQPFARGAHYAILSTIEVDSAGSPEWLTHAVVAAAPALAARIKGERSHLPSWPSSHHWVNNPGVPFLSGDIKNDPRMDAATRLSFSQAGVGRIAALPLAIRGRWVGLLSIGWASEQPFSPLDQRIYQRLCQKLALVVDYRLLFATAEEALREAQRQRTEQESIIENMSVGVVLADTRTGNILRMNKHMVALMQFGNERVGDPARFERRTLEPGTDVDIPASEWPLQRTITTGARSEAEHDLLRPDGTRVTAHVAAIPLRDESGAVAKCLVVLTDITDRKRAERERLRMQEELIQAQADALAERGNPLIPISKEIVVMPVIGSIDVTRGQEMMTALLEGASRARARFAILDITGARQVDAPAASALIGAAKALRLLGIEPVLTGVRPAISQTLVSLGLDFADIVTRGTLESGIAYASGRRG